MTQTTVLPPLPSTGACALPHLGVIRATGPDAATFFHNQLTQDFLLLKPEQARLAAFCNAKGRMQASMIGFKTGPEEVLLVMRQDLLAQTLKRLSMFVLRSKVKLSDASAELVVWGCLGHSTLPAWSLTSQDTAWEVMLYPAVGVSRSLQVWPSASAPAQASLDLNDWLLGEVLSGIADVQAASFEAFVPQMLNYESVDGVNFKKGCYPGQEVVARSQFRGTLKRRTYLASAQALLTVGQEVFAASDPAQPAGVVAQATHHPLHGDWALLCLQTQAADQGDLHLGTVAGAALHLHPLPYALREDI